MVIEPDTSARPFDLAVERDMGASADAIYRAWTERFDGWFAAAGTLTMTPEEGALFFFETHFDGGRHPHYGRFLRLEPGRLIEHTWVTGDPGTKGAETVLRLELEPQPDGARVTLTHRGLPDAASRDGHADAWPQVLELLDKFASDEYSQ